MVSFETPGPGREEFCLHSLAKVGHRVPAKHFIVPVSHVHIKMADLKFKGKLVQRPLS